MGAFLEMESTHDIDAAYVKSGLCRNVLLAEWCAIADVLRMFWKLDDHMLVVPVMLPVKHPPQPVMQVPA